MRLFFINRYIKQKRLKSLLLCISLCLNAQAVDATEVIVSANAVGQLKNSHKLQAIFSLRTLYWPNGEKIKVFVALLNFKWVNYN